MLVGIAAFFLPSFRERWATCNGNGIGIGIGIGIGNRNCNGGAKAGLQARVALGRHGWVGGTRCKYVHVSSCDAIHGNTRSRQPTRAYPLTVSSCATKKPAPAAPLHWLGLVACLSCLVRLICVTFSDRVAAPVRLQLGFTSPWPPANCRRRGVCGLAGPLCRMDAAHEPPWMGLRRVPRTHTPHAWPSHLGGKANDQRSVATLAQASGDQNSAATVMNTWRGALAWIA